MEEADEELVLELFDSGTIRVLVAPYSKCWQMSSHPAHLAILMGEKHYNAAELRHVDYDMSDMLQMVSCANLPSSRAVVMCQAANAKYLEKFMSMPLPIESHLEYILHDALCAEIVEEIVENKQDAVDFLTWTFLYRRLVQNPIYYNMRGRSNEHISDHLSELIEETIGDLAEAGCIAVEPSQDGGPDNVSALNLGMICSYYYVNYASLELFAASLNGESKLKSILSALCGATEFEDFQGYYSEERLLRELSRKVKLTVGGSPDFSNARTVVNIILQAHLSRMSLGETALKKFLLEVLKKSMALCEQ